MNTVNRCRLVCQRIPQLQPLKDASRTVGKGDGALIVLGNGPSVEAVCSGGFDLHDSTFTVARVAELAKMDGAIIVAYFLSCGLVFTAALVLGHNKDVIPQTRL